MAKLRETWPNALSLERLALSRSGEGGARRAALRQLDTANLFASFLREVADEEMDEARRAAFNEVLKGLDPEKRNG
jgi:exonuclease SbcD